MAETSLCEIFCAGCGAGIERSLDGQTWIAHNGHWWHMDCAPSDAKKEPNPPPCDIPVKVPKYAHEKSYLHGFADGLRYADQRAKG